MEGRPFVWTKESCPDVQERSWTACALHCQLEARLADGSVVNFALLTITSSSGASCWVPDKEGQRWMVARTRIMRTSSEWLSGLGSWGPAVNGYQDSDNEDQQWMVIRTRIMRTSSEWLSGLGSSGQRWMVARTRIMRTSSEWLPGLGSSGQRWMVARTRIMRTSSEWLPGLG